MKLDNNFKSGYVEVLNNQIVGDVYITTSNDFGGSFWLFSL